MLRDTVEPRSARPGNLFRAFERICKAQWDSVPAEGVLDVLISASFNAFKAGLAAATFATADPFLAEFAAGIQPPLDSPRMPLSWRSLMWSPVLAWGQPVWHSLAHPLLKLATTYYPYTPNEKEAILPFLIEQLWTLGQPSEDKCPVSEKLTLEWVLSALNYGRVIKDNQPECLAEIFAEVGESKMEAIRQSVQSFVKRAGGTEPAVLADAILRWHNDTLKWHESAT